MVYVLLFVFAVMLAWGSLWTIVLVMAAKRRRAGKNTYWLDCVAALVVELAIAAAISLINPWGLLFGPLAGAFVGGVYYFWVSEYRDRQLGPT
jgi:hypothetical protein